MSEIPTEEQVDDVIDVCEELGNETLFPGMTYEQGVKAGIEWMTGNYGELGEGPLE